jgi:hypothetical protein
MSEGTLLHGWSGEKGTSGFLQDVFYYMGKKYFCFCGSPRFRQFYPYNFFQNFKKMSSSISKILKTDI